MSYRLLLDTSSLMYRAFFALPASISDQNGRPINAVHGYLDMTARLITDYAPDELIHVYDADWRPAGRVALYPPYKGDRPEDPETLPPQFERLRAILTALGESQAEAPHWEADDAIGTLCATAAPTDHLAIVTGDRDLLQLVQDGTEATPKIEVLYTVRGVSTLDTYDEVAVTQKYNVPPQRYVDFAILRGDPSDGLPGVKGIGEKTAAKLIATYSDLDALLADADRQSARIAANLKEAAPYIATMQQVVPVRKDVAVTMHVPQRDEALVKELAAAFGLTGPVKRLESARQNAERKS
ncbi:MAG: 5'-3' exonuclease [Caldilineaceae bacterium]|nr:5'-3' exonuclease [Caldilineaceae bacterium]